MHRHRVEVAERPQAEKLLEPAVGQRDRGGADDPQVGALRLDRAVGALEQPQVRLRAFGRRAFRERAVKLVPHLDLFDLPPVVPDKLPGVVGEAVQPLVGVGGEAAVVVFVAVVEDDERVDRVLAAPRHLPPMGV